MELLKDANGHTSSKRVAGFLGLIIFGFISIFAVMKDPNAIGLLVWPWAVVVGGLFGISVLEKKL